MKALRQILLASVAAVVGFALGSIGKKAQPVPAPSRPERSLTTPIAASPDAGDEAISQAMSALMARVKPLPPAEHEVFLRRLLANWTKRDPQAATQWMQPRLAGYAKDSPVASGFANFDTDLVNTGAENAPELALDFARQHSGTGLSRTILHSAIFNWPDKD